MFWYGWHMPFWLAGMMWAVMILFAVLLIWGGYLLITSLTRRPDRDYRGTGTHGTARQILDERLARGEIDAEEYRRIKDLIGGPTDGAERAETTQ